MSATWRTWLLVRDLDESLQGWARRASLLDRFEFSARPLASLNVEGSDAVLRTPDKVALFAYLNRTASPGKPPLRVFAATNGSHLPVLHGKEFFHRGLKYRFVRDRQSLNASDPYGHRLFEVEHLGTDVPRDQQTGQTVVLEAPPREGAALFFDPLPIELSDASIAELVQDLQPGGAYADISGGCFLPPVRSASHPEVAQSYFGDEPTKLRRELRVSRDIDAPKVDEPVAVHLQRLTDTPMLRDILLDGGSLSITCDEGAPTRMCLNVNADGRGWISARARMVLDGQILGPAWSVHIGRAISEDVAALVAAVLPADRPSQWTFDADPSNNMVQLDGSWHRLMRLVLPALNRTAEFFRTKILDQSMLYHAGTFDHYLAESWFMAYAWRCPWPGDDREHGAWRRATLDFVEHELGGQPRSAQERVSDWNDEARRGAPGAVAFVARTEAPPQMRIRYTGDPDDQEMLFRRLLLPVGTVLNARTIYLDKGARSRLDQGLVLA